MLKRLLRPLLAAGIALSVLPAVTPRIASAATITVTHYGAAFYGAPYAVALKKGYFKQHHVDVTGFLTSTGGGTTVRNTLAGGLPYGEVALSAAVEAINAGQPLEIINGGVDTVADILWIAKPGSPLHSIKDLKGKRVGYTEPGSVTNMLILMALKAAGMTPNEVHLVAAGGIGANLSGVLNGAIDTGMTGEPVWSENKSKVQPVFWVKNVMSPRMMQTVGVTTREFAKTHGATLRGIIAARREGVQFIYAHPNQAADIVAAMYHGNAKLYRAVFQNFVKIHYWDQGTLDYKGMNAMVEGLQIVGKQKGPVDWKKIVSTAFLPKDLASASK
jgi:NitT/TauT family transport system substrate-binding protein